VPNSLISKFSILQKTLNAIENIDVSKFQNYQGIMQWLKTSLKKHRKFV
jgi:hypothetical protein